MSALMLIAGLAMLVATAAVVAPRLAPPTLVGLTLTAYLVAWADVLAVTLALSVVDALERGTVLAGLAAVLVGALALARLRPAPRRDGIRSGRAALRDALGDPPVAVLAIAAGAALLYSAVLGLATPPNDWDAMTYHLARAAFWIQQDGVGYVPGSQIVRIDANPPNAEIGSAVTMLLSRGDRFVWLPQYTALAALLAGIAGIARLLGLGRRAALWGALLFATLPPVVLQASSALNDLVVTSFLVTAAYFFLRERRSDLVLGGLAVALAVGTKFTALIALPLLALVVLAGQPRRRWPALAASGLAGVVAGSYWIAVNLVETGAFDGGAGGELEQHPDRSAAAVLARTTRLLVNFADDLNLERDAWIYPMAAAVVALVAWLTERRARRRWLVPATALVVGCLPLAMSSVREGLLRTHEKLWLTLGHDALARLGESRESWSPSTVLSYFGPLALVLLLAAGALVALEARRRTLRPLALLLAGSPLALALLLALALVYDPWRGRFFTFGLALAASTWGVVLRRRALAWGVVSVAVVTLFLSFVHSLEKPAGIELLEAETAEGVWGKPRETVQTWLRPDGTVDVVRYFASTSPTGRVGVQVEEDDWVYPLFGRRLSRTVSFVPAGASLDGLDWLVTHRGQLEPGAGWRRVLRTGDGWRVYERERGAVP